MREAVVGTFAGAPLRSRLYVGATVVLALVLPLLLHDLGAPEPQRANWLPVALLVLVSALNVEVGRALSGGLSQSHQPHKALSAWAFVAGMLLPPPWLLVIVPLTYAHARWRGLRVPMWKWVGSAAFLVLAGLAAGLMVHEVLIGSEPAGGLNWMDGNGGRGLVALTVAALTFLLVESALFAGSAYLNHAEDEVWLRHTLRSPSFYLTELGVLIIGALLCAVWTGGAWFVLLFLPLYTMVQRAALHAPLSASNEALARANRFKVDLMAMLGHEIGNPLTSVMGHAQVGSESLASGDATQARRSLEVVERNAVQIRLVLHDILTLVSSESGELVAQPEDCLVSHHVRAAVSGLPPGRQPSISCPEALSARVQPNHLDQMLANLLGNAEKYGGGATTVEVLHDQERVEIQVVDAGPGVPDSVRENLFQRFSRGHETSGNVSGTGLGLFITRQLAQANGGQVSHRDGLTSGSVFSLSLPRA